MLGMCFSEMGIYRIYSIVILISYAEYRLCEEYIERWTGYGKIRGLVKEVLPGKFVELFLGVPYARPPIGELRFEYPTKPEPWVRTLDATSLPPACPQHLGDMDYLQIHYPGFKKASEDCLYLNIYIPRIDIEKEPLATFLWIHGGSNEYGMGAMLTGEVLAAHGGIIVVNFNYRLGNLGFLHMDTKIFPGNFGLVDQIEVIKWVNQNIHHLGGNPRKVTLAGHSAGAADVGIHLLNSHIKGLFSRAIIMSGSPLSYWAMMNENVEPVYQRKVQKYLKSVGCIHEDIASVKRCLKSKGVSELSTHFRLTVPQMLVHPMPVDNITLFGSPIKLLSEGKFTAIPVMLGFTRDEGAMIAEANPNYAWMLYDHRMLKKTIKNYRRVKKFSSRFEEIVAHEYMNYSIQDEYERCVDAYVQIESDTSIKVPTLHLARLIQNSIRRKNTPDNVYLYSFDFHNEATFQSVYNKVFGKPAIPHGRDLFYIFGIPLVGHPDYNFTSTDISLSKHLMTIWATFVKTGNPSNTSPQSEDWFPPFNKENKTFIRISNYETGYKIQSQGPFNMRAYDFWTKVEWLFHDWTEESCSSSKSHKLDLILPIIFICILILIEKQ